MYDSVYIACAAAEVVSNMGLKLKLIANQFKSAAARLKFLPEEPAAVGVLQSGDTVSFSALEKHRVSHSPATLHIAAHIWYTCVHAS